LTIDIDIMKAEKELMVSLAYKMYVKADDGTEELWEEATEKRPLLYCHGTGMMLPSFEAHIEGKEPDEEFDFVLSKDEAYGDYDPAGQMTFAKEMFYTADGVFDDERVIEGNIIQMLTEDRQRVNAQVMEVNEDNVVLDLNHPLAGEDLHFVGKVVRVRYPSMKELNAARRRETGCCGGCGGGGCDNGGCEGGGCEGGCGGCGEDEE